MLAIKKMILNDETFIIGMDKEKDLVFILSKGTYGVFTWKGFRYWDKYHTTKSEISSDKMEHTKKHIIKRFTELKEDNQHYMYADRLATMERERELFQKATKVLESL